MYTLLYTVHCTCRRESAMAMAERDGMGVALLQAAAVDLLPFPRVERPDMGAARVSGPTRAVSLSLYRRG